MRTTLRATTAVAALLTAVSAEAAVSDATIERLEDGQVRIEWTAANGEDVDVFAAVGPGADISNAELVSESDGDGEHVQPADPERPFFLLRTADGEIHRTRLLPLEGGLNFRDIGGYETGDGRRVKWGRIFRSAELSGLTDADYLMIDRLGLNTIYDLRSIDERLSQPTDWRAAPVQQMSLAYRMDIAQYVQAMRDMDPAQLQQMMAGSYSEMLDDYAPQLQAVFEELLAGDAPLLYHCSAGTDRTGVTTALILSALGVPRETIIADYRLSERYYREPFMAGKVQAPADSPLAEAMDVMRQMPPETLEALMGESDAQLRAFFAAVDEQYGSVEAYLDQKLGVDAQDVAQLRTLYTE